MNFGGELVLITKLWTGMEDFFFNGRCEFSGLPSFAKMFFELLQEPKIGKIHVVLFIPAKHSKLKGLSDDHVRLPERYSRKLEVHLFKYGGRVSELVATLKALLTVLRLVRNRDIKVIYGHGRFGTVGALVSKLTGVPNVRRFYGAHGMRKLLKGGPILAFLKDPLTTLSIMMPADAVIVTDDGTGGDKVFTPERCARYGIKKFLQLMNGVDKNLDEKLIPPKFRLPEHYIAMLGRIEPIKGQHLLIQALKVLKDSGVEIPALIVGHVSDPHYFAHLQELVAKYELEDQVRFTGGLSWYEALYVMKNATVSCLLSTFSNLSNVLLESLVLGVPTIAVEFENNLAHFPDDVLIKIPSEATKNTEIIAQTLLKFLTNPELRTKFSTNAREFARKSLMDWKERISLEKELILAYFNNLEQPNNVGQCG